MGWVEMEDGCTHQDRFIDVRNIGEHTRDL